MSPAQRAARAPAWRWVSGMLVHESDGRTYRYSHVGEVPSADAIPDLRDPATVGGLIAQLRGARREPLGYLAPVPEVGWCWISGPYDGARFTGPSMDEALVAALEAATDTQNVMAQERKLATKQERAAIVAYLRERANADEMRQGLPVMSPAGRGLLALMADLIERAAHHDVKP